MSKEARVQISLQIRKVSGEIVQLDERTSPTTYTADVTGTKGPSPGDLTIPVGGEAISFGELDTPGLCWMMNRDDTNYVTYGIWDVGINVFYPLGELKAGEMTVIRLSRALLEEYVGTGTGTTGPDNRFFMKANTAPVVVSIKAFED